MKRLQRMLLINWYYFEKQIIEFGRLTFLTGKNATGKSTIIDALQLVLLADTSGSYFNKSANDKSKRTLSGYLRGELSDDGGSGFTYLRNENFSSYIALEFYDEEKQRHFTAGCCFDFNAENDIPHVFFGYFGPLPADCFIEARYPANIRRLRQRLKSTYPEKDFYITETNKQFRDYLYGKLGGLPTKFADLFKKAVPFDPIADIQKFITEFVFSEERALNVPQMQDTLHSYAELKREAERLQTRIEALQGISGLYAEYARYKAQAFANQYIADRAQAEQKQAEYTRQQAALQKRLREREQLQAQLLPLEQNRADLETERIRIAAEIRSSSTQQTIERYEREIKGWQQAVAACQEQYQKWAGHVRALTQNWGQLCRRAKALPPADEGLFSDRLRIRCESLATLCQTAERLLRCVEGKALCELDLSLLAEADEAVANLAQEAGLLKESLKEEQDTLARQLQALNEEKKELEAGRQTYDHNVTALRSAVDAALQSRFGPAARVRLVAELWDVRDPAWRNAIEGYLNTQRCNFLVDPRHYDTAAAEYNRVKERLHIFGVTIVNLNVVLRDAPVCQPGSLAEEIETDDANARAYANFLLGRVMKCTDFSQHTRHPISITKEGMLYQQKGVRRINPAIWQRPLLGQGARLLRLAQLEQELAALRQKIQAHALLSQGLQALPRQQALGDQTLEECRQALDAHARIPALTEQINARQAQLDAIDRGPLLALEAQQNALADQLAALAERIRTLNVRSGRLDGEICRLQNESLPTLERELAQLRAALASQYDAGWQRETGEPQYLQAIASHAKLEEVADNYRRSAKAASTSQEKARKALRDARMDYNRAYQTGLDEEAETNEAFDQILQELTKNALPAYLSKIQDSQDKAMEQFREEFLGILYDNINNAQRAIANLNDALLHVPFSEDTYQFDCKPNPDYIRYYRMIMDPMKMGNYSLFSTSFNEKYKEEIDELFRLLTENSDTDRDAYKRVQQFTNYRTYLTFDLLVTNSEGITQRLSKTMAKKSGGETQTPFYVAVLASFTRIYRMQQDRSSGTIRLIVFDEAFSKMDGDRIEQSIQILRNFDFQVLLSAPTDKIGDIATLVDRNLCVLRKGRHTLVKAFEPKELLPNAL